MICIPPMDYFCPQDGCAYKCDKVRSMEIHYRTHTGERPFQCKICNQKFNRKDLCKTHIKTHKRRDIENAKENASENSEHIIDLGWNEIEFESVEGKFFCPYPGCDYKNKVRAKMGDHYRKGYKSDQVKINKQY